MTKTDLLKDITAKFDSFDEKHLNKNLNLYLPCGKKLELSNLMHVTPYHWWMFDRGTGCRPTFIHCVSMVTHFPFFHSLVTKCFLLIFTEFEHYEVIVQSVSELQEGPAVGIATCSLLKPTPTCKTTVDFFRLSADGESEFKLNV